MSLKLSFKDRKKYSVASITDFYTVNQSTKLYFLKFFFLNADFSSWIITWVCLTLTGNDPFKVLLSAACFTRCS